MGFTVGLGASAFVLAAPFAAPVVASIGLGGALVLLGAFVVALTDLGVVLGNCADHVAAKRAVATEFSGLIGQIADATCDSPTTLLHALMQVDEGAVFFESDPASTRTIAVQRQRLADQFSRAAARTLSSLDASARAELLTSLSGQHMVRQRGLQTQVGRCLAEMPRETQAGHFLENTLRELSARQADRYAQRLRTVGALLSEEIDSGDRQAVCKELLRLLERRALPLETAAQIADDMVGGANALTVQAKHAENVVKCLTKMAQRERRPPGDKIMAIHDFLRASAKSDVLQLPGPFQQRVASLDQEIREAIESHELSKATTMLSRREGLLRASCLDTARVSLLHEPSAMASLNELLEVYSENDRHPLRQMASRLELNSMSEERPRQAHYYLQGPPGVGKSYFVQELAKIVRVPVFTCPGSSPELLGLLGSQRPSDPPGLGDRAVSDERLVGLLAAAMLKTGVDNPILLVDCADTALRNQRVGVAPLGEADTVALRPENKILKLDGLGRGLQLDASRVTIVFVGNHEMASAAMRRHVECIRFPSMDPATKRKVVVQQLDASLAQVPATQREEVRSRIEPHIPLMLRFDREARCPGARQLQHLVSDLVLELREQKALGISDSPSNVAERVTQYYAEGQT